MSLEEFMILGIFTAKHEQYLVNARITREAAAYFDAVNRGDITAALGAFHPEARILDVDRMVAGLPEIGEWLKCEVMGGRYKVIYSSPMAEATLVLLEFTTPDTGETFRANYILTFREGKIETAKLQYA